jgi:dihydrofolate reductase
MNEPILSIIVVIDQNRGIGKDNKLLVSLPMDLKRFKKLTMGHPVIMGRKTYESILNYAKGSLPGRTNIVITSDLNLKREGFIFVDSLELAIEKAKEIDKNEIFIIGGASIYNQAINLVDRLYLTLVKGTFNADSFFPDYSKFLKIISSEDFKSGPYSCTFYILEKP